MKRVIITGSSGLCATELLHLLIETTDYKIYAISTKPSAISWQYPNEKVTCLSLQEMEESAKNEKITFDVLIHFAFARSGKGYDYAASLDYLRNVLNMATNISLKSFVYISSQSVYGQKNKPFWTEETPVSPEDMYALAKYAGEVIVNTALQKANINYTNIRLASVCEKARFLNVFAKNILLGKPIKVIGGNQTCSMIDVRDVADALKYVIEYADKLQFANIYNLGIGKKISILELAELMKTIAEEYCNISGEIIKEENDIYQDVGMNNERFETAFSWAPKYNYSDMAFSLLYLNLGIVNDDIPYSYLVKYKDMF